LKQRRHGYATAVLRALARTEGVVIDLDQPGDALVEACFAAVHGSHEA